MLYSEMITKWGDDIALAMKETKENDDHKKQHEIRDFPDAPHLKQYLCLFEASEEDLDEEAFEMVFSAGVDDSSSSSDATEKRKRKRRPRNQKRRRRPRKLRAPAPKRKARRRTREKARERVETSLPRWGVASGCKCNFKCFSYLPILMV